MLAPYGDQIEIKYATNGTTLGIKGERSVHKYWPKFRSVAVNVSIDGIGPVYEYIRGNGDWDTLVQNIQTIQAIPNISRIVGAVTVQVSNVLILDQMIELFLDQLGIVFHTHRVAYPELLSIQVLPRKIKEQAVKRLINIEKRLKSFKMIQLHPELLEYTRGQIQDNINYLISKDQSRLWPDCVEFNRRLDATRNQNFTDVTPEFKPHV